jgi:hypothetical protein
MLASTSDNPAIDALGITAYGAVVVFVASFVMLAVRGGEGRRLRFGRVGHRPTSPTIGIEPG